MNFFGHAWLAHRNEAARGAVRAEFVLGAMIPDFAVMLGARPPRASLESLAEGVSFHHRTDEAFHGARSFLHFSRSASAYLDAHGLPRGTARAVAHVGVELLLDVAFAREPEANEAYLCAIGSGLRTLVTSHIHWPTRDLATRFEQLCRSLQRNGAWSPGASADLVAQRLRRILADRPRLAMDDAGQSVVREWVLRARPQIATGAALLLSEVEQRLHQPLAQER